MSLVQSGASEQMKKAATRFLGSLGMMGRSRIEGFVDHVLAGEIVGWAYDPTRPSRRVLIVAVADGAVIAETLADLPRRDLINLGKGDGRHGFRLRIPGDLPEAARISLRIEAVAGPRNVLLQRGKIEISAAEAVQPAAPSRTEVLCGFLERWHDGEISGWAVDPANPKGRISVDIFDGERFLGAAPCDQERPKLAASGAPSGARGFAFKPAAAEELGAGNELRARISGSRLELRRSKSYPGTPQRPSDFNPLEPAAAFDEPLAAPAPVEFALPEPAPSEELRAMPSGLAILVCGEGSREMVDETLASCRAQDWPEVETIRLGPDAVDDQRPGLEAILAARRTAVLLKPGQVADAGMARALCQARGAFDVCSWPAGSDISPTRGPDIAALLNGFSGGLALRAALLSRFEGDLAATLCAGDLDTLAGWSARSGFRWLSLPAPLASAPSQPGRMATIAPAAVPRRVSLAIWSGWAEPQWPALKALLAGCKDMDVEILAPDPVVGDDLIDLVPEGLASLTVKRVGVPAVPGDGALWRQMTEAATGQVVVLCHGGVRLRRPETLSQVCAWAMAPRIGAVTVDIVGSREAPLSGLAIEADDGGLGVRSAGDETSLGRARLVPAAPAAFMAISRNALASVGGFDADRLALGPADLDLGLRLRRAGRTSIVFGGAEAVTEDELLAGWTKRPIGPADAAVLGEDLHAATLRPGALPE
jgi:hypothetical protein